MRQKRLSNWLSRWQTSSRNRRGRPQEQELGSRSNATSWEAAASPTSAISSSAGRSPVAELSSTPAATQASSPLQPGGSVDTPLEQRLSTALDAVWSELRSRASQPSFIALLERVYGGTTGDAAAFQAAAGDLITQLATGSQLGLRFELLTSLEMGDARGAYAAIGPTAAPRSTLIATGSRTPAATLNDWC